MGLKSVYRAYKAGTWSKEPVSIQQLLSFHDCVVSAHEIAAKQIRFVFGGLATMSFSGLIFVYSRDLLHGPTTS